LLPSGVFVPDGNTEGKLDDEKDEGVGAMPKTSDIWDADFEDRFLAAIALARCL
jgi:hypothetical protein